MKSDKFPKFDFEKKRPFSPFKRPGAQPIRVPLIKKKRSYLETAHWHDIVEETYHAINGHYPARAKLEELLVKLNDVDFDPDSPDDVELCTPSFVPGESEYEALKDDIDRYFKANEVIDLTQDDEDKENVWRWNK